MSPFFYFAVVPLRVYLINVSTSFKCYRFCKHSVRMILFKWFRFVKYRFVLYLYPFSVCLNKKLFLL